MKKTFLFILAICITTCPGTSHAAGGYCSDDGLACLWGTDCIGSQICLVPGGGGNGASCRSTTDCMDGFYCSSNKCTPYPDCTAACSTCTSHDWSSYSTGYESKTTANCNTLTCVCNKSTSYRCAAGYYGSSSNGSSGCTACPSGSTSSAGSTSRSSCCESDSTGSDVSGSWLKYGCCYS